MWTLINSWSNVQPMQQVWRPRMRGRSKMQAIRNSYATDMRGSACAHDRSEGSSGCGGSSGRGAGLLLGGRRDGIGLGIGLGRGAGTRSGGNGSHGAAQPSGYPSRAPQCTKSVSQSSCVTQTDK